MAPTVANKRAPWLWWLVILLLALLVLGQGAWLGRASLAQYSLGQQLLTALCSSLDCQVPQLRDPSQIQVVSREMAVTEDRPGVLVFLLLMKNGATFAQPWPYLELALYGNDQKPAGMRIFTPEEYLGSPEVPRLMMPDQTAQGRLELQDPGRAVTGFEIRFL
jgi:hypothetical protein